MADGDSRDLLLAHKSAIEAAIAANRAAAVDAAARFVLAGLTARLERLLKALERDLVRPLGGPFGTAGRWGANGRGPAIEDLIRRSARQRAPMADANASHDLSSHPKGTNMAFPTERERSLLYSALIGGTAAPSPGRITPPPPAPAERRRAAAGAIAHGRH